MSKNKVKSMEAVCKMLDHCSIPYSGLTVYFQGVTHCETKPHVGGAVLISANAYPKAKFTTVDGKKLGYPITLGQ